MLRGPGNRPGAVSYRAPQPSPKRPAGLGPGLEAAASLSSTPTSVSCSLWDLALPFGQLEEPEGLLGPGRLVLSVMTVGQRLATSL